MKACPQRTDGLFSFSGQQMVMSLSVMSGIEQEFKMKVAIANHLIHLSCRQLKEPVRSERVDDVGQADACDNEAGGKEEVVRKIEYAFRRSGHESLRGVTPWCFTGMVELTGSVPSFYLKQVAQELVRQALPQYTIMNHCRVRPLLHLPPE